MVFYLGIYAILWLGSLFDLFDGNKNQRKLVYIGLSILLFTLSWIRWETGTDWINYYNFFLSKRAFFEESEFEYGFSRINEIGKLWFDSYTGVLFLLGAILFYAQNTAIYKLSPYPIISLLFLWCTQFGSILFIRQMVATAILLLSVPYILKKDLLKFLICIFVACLFHRTSFIFLVAWLGPSLKLTFKQLLVISVVAIFISESLVIIISSISGIFGSFIEAKLASYLLDPGSTAGSEVTNTVARLRGLSNKILILLFGIWTFSRCPNYKIRSLINIYWIGVLLYLLLTPLSLMFARFTYAFDIVQIIIIPIFFSTLNKSNNKLIGFFVFSIYLILRLNTSLSSYPQLLIPYKTIFD